MGSSSLGKARYTNGAAAAWEPGEVFKPGSAKAPMLGLSVCD